MYLSANIGYISVRETTADFAIKVNLTLYGFSSLGVYTGRGSMGSGYFLLSAVRLISDGIIQ